LNVPLPRSRKVAAIVDAASADGRARARAYADAGWNVALLGRGWDGLEAAAADVRTSGREALVLPVDVTDEAARHLAIERIQDELGPIEAWVAEGLVPRYDPRREAYHPAPASHWRWDLPPLAGAIRTPAPAILAVAGVVVTGVALGVLSRRN
jgi:NAD(P)-dependent dehydrogenase (short-subunit alcohol dehydrogenase family)